MTSFEKVRPVDFFEQHPVFRYEEFVATHSDRGGRSRQTSATVLKQHTARGRLIHVRRGVYATVPRGIDPDQHQVDPYLLATELADDAVVAYHAALQFHGKAYSVWRRFHYLTRSRQPRFTFRSMEFVPVQAPRTLRMQTDLGGGVSNHRHAGGHVRVTTLERTLVDVMDAPQRSGGWEEVWRSLETIEFLDLDAVLAHVRALGSAVTAARVGFFLELHRGPLMVEPRYLEDLHAQAPAQPRYLDARREPGKLINRWNLIVPERVLAGSWSEVP